MTANGTGAPGLSLPHGYTGKTWDGVVPCNCVIMVKGEALRSHKERLLVVGKWTGFISGKYPLRFGKRGEKQDNCLPCLRRAAPITTGQDKATGCRGTGWVAAGGWGVLFTVLRVLSAHRMQQPPQPNHLAKLPGTGPGCFTTQLSSGGCLGSWATANGKNKTAHTGDKKP